MRRITRIFRSPQSPLLFSVVVLLLMGFFD